MVSFSCRDKALRAHGMDVVWEQVGWQPRAFHSRRSGLVALTPQEIRNRYKTVRHVFLRSPENVITTFTPPHASTYANNLSALLLHGENDNGLCLTSNLSSSSCLCQRKLAADLIIAIERILAAGLRCGTRPLVGLNSGGKGTGWQMKRRPISPFRMRFDGVRLSSEVRRFYRIETVEGIKRR